MHLEKALSSVMCQELTCPLIAGVGQQGHSLSCVPFLLSQQDGHKAAQNKQTKMSSASPEVYKG